MTDLVKTDVYEVIEDMRELDLALGEYLDHVELNYDVYTESEMFFANEIARVLSAEFGAGWEKLRAEEIEEWFSK